MSLWLYFLLFTAVVGACAAIGFSSGEPWSILFALFMMAIWVVILGQFYS